jgi:hypothetical protein
MALLAAGLSLIAVSIFHPAFREGRFLKTSGCFPLSAGLAVLVLGAAGAGGWFRAGFWLAIAGIGQAAALQWIDAGKLIHYQHYVPLPKFATAHPWLLVLIGAQVSLLTFEFRKHARGVWSWVREHYRGWTLLALIAVFTLSSAALSRNPADYAKEAVLATLLQILSMVSMVTAAASLSNDAAKRVGLHLNELLEDRGPGMLRGSRLARYAALWVTAAAGLLSYFVYENHPHIPDEVVYLHQARYLAEGRLSLPVPPVPEAFEVYLMDLKNGQWFASPPIGWSAVLALGVLLGIPWLVNPVLAGCNVLLAYRLLEGVFDPKTARMGVLLLAVSPWYVFMAMNFMMHTLTLTCALLASVAILRCRHTNRASWAGLAGLATGFTAHIRPMDAVVVATVLGLWAIGLGGKRLRFAALAAFVLGTIVTGAMVFPYNARLSGNPKVFPLNAYVDRVFGPGKNDLGFGPDRGIDFGGLEAFPGHGLPDVLVNGALNTFALNTELLGWGTGSLLPILLLVFSGRMRRRDWAMLAVIALVFVAFSLYWYSGGPDFGARYWYLTILPLVALTVSAVRFLEDHVSEAVRPRILACVAAMCLVSLINYFPWRAIDKYHHYLRMRPDVRELARQIPFGNDLVLVRGDGHPDYSSAWVNNPLSFDRPGPVYAHWKPELAERLWKAFPDRNVWLLDGPTRTKAGYQVQGPFRPEEFFSRRQE